MTEVTFSGKAEKQVKKLPANRREIFVDSQRNVPVFSQRILPDTESGLNQYLKKQ